MNIEQNEINSYFKRETEKNTTSKRMELIYFELTDASVRESK